MKKEDFIVGEWYVSSQWRNTTAAKFLKFGGSDILYSSEYIQRKHITALGNFRNDFDSYKLANLDDIIKYLPNDHPDKSLTETTRPAALSGYIRLLEGFSSRHTGEIYSTSTPFPKIFEWTDKKSWAELLNSQTYRKDFAFVSEEEYIRYETNKKFKDVQFSEKGYVISSDPADLFILKAYLEIDREFKNNAKTTPNIIVWDKTFVSYYTLNRVEEDGNVNLNSFKEYSVTQMFKIINTLKTNKNEQQENDGCTTKVQTITNKDSRPSITGKIIFRRGGQQITAGSRPEGNRTCIDIRKSNIRSIKISRSIVRTGHS